MNKRIIISIIILLLLAGVAVFWVAQREEQSQQDQVQQDKQVEEQQMVAKEENVFSQEELEKIEKLKNDNSLVWYEIPEMGIRFRVTPDTKEDLEYEIQNYKNVQNESVVTAILYSFDQVGNSYDEKCRLSEEGWGCTRLLLSIPSSGFISNYKNKHNREWCIGYKKDEGPRGIFIPNTEVCYWTISEELDIADVEYEELFNTSSSKRGNIFGIYLSTFEKF